MDRNPISDLGAQAAMPGLEVLADILVRHVSSGRLRRPQALGVLIFLGGRLLQQSSFSVSTKNLVMRWHH